MYKEFFSFTFAVCPTRKFTILLKIKTNLNRHSQLISSLKELIRQEDGKWVCFCRFCLHITKCFFWVNVLFSRFYTLLVISTALFDKPPFKNLIVNGLVLAAWVDLLFSYRARYFSLVSKLVAFLFTCSKCFAFIVLGHVRFVHVCLYLHGLKGWSKDE